MSHDNIMRSYLFLGLIFGCGVGLLNLAAFTLGGIQNNTFQDLEPLKLVLIGATPCLLLTAIMFQVDPKRPGIQLITSFIISLFIGTAIFASWLSVLLIPVIIYYSHNYQKDAYFKS